MHQKMRTISTSERASDDASILANRANQFDLKGIRMPPPPPPPPPPQSNRKANPVHAMIAGYVAGCSGTIVGYPLETVKVWIQTNSLGENQHLDGGGNKNKSNRVNTFQRKKPGYKKWSQSSGGKKAMSASSSSRRSNSTKALPLFHHSSEMANTAHRRATLYRRFLAKPFYKAYGAFRALYSGVMGPLVTIGMIQSVNFATVDATRRFLYSRRALKEGFHPEDPREYLAEDSLYAVAVAGFMGGGTTAFVTAPLLMVKLRQQITGETFGKAIKEIFFVKNAASQRKFRPFRPYGIAFLPHSLTEATGRALYVGSYEGYKRYLVQFKNKGNEDDVIISSLSLQERMMCAAGSGVTCWGIFFPIDTLRNRMYDAVSRGDVKGNANSIIGTFRLIRVEKAFYRGYLISMVRAGPVAASVLPVYDMTLEKLSAWR